VTTRTLPPAEVWLSDKAVAARYGVHFTTIWRWSADANLGFPKPVKFAGTTRWCITALDAFDSRQAARAAAGAASTGAAAAPREGA
jgi:prophage regulatory protein